MAGATTCGRDEDKPEATLLPGGRAGAAGAAVLDRVLEDNITLFVNAVE